MRSRMLRWEPNFLSPWLSEEVLERLESTKTESAEPKSAEPESTEAEPWEVFNIWVAVEKLQVDQRKIGLSLLTESDLEPIWTMKYFWTAGSIAWQEEDLVLGLQDTREISWKSLEERLHGVNISLYCPELVCSGSHSSSVSNQLCQELGTNICRNT